MRVKIEDIKYKVKKKRNCCICNSKVKFFIGEHDTFEDCTIEESIKIWKNKKSFIYCDKCISKIDRLKACKHFYLDCNILSCEAERPYGECNQTNPNECSKFKQKKRSLIL